MCAKQKQVNPISTPRTTFICPEAPAPSVKVLVRCTWVGCDLLLVSVIVSDVVVVVVVVSGVFVTVEDESRVTEPVTELDSDVVGTSDLVLTVRLELPSTIPMARAVNRSRIRTNTSTFLDKVNNAPQTAATIPFRHSVKTSTTISSILSIAPYFAQAHAVSCDL